jgi:2-polyprenyl-6-methoxyphenol hydroxylase-like FAD-dependent oxidoreductase
VVKPKAVAILGAGPVGLAAAAHALERGLEPVVLEAGSEVAHSVRQWRHVRMFSPWEYNIDKAAERLLKQVGWNAAAPDQYPTGGELVAQYLEPLAMRTQGFYFTGMKSYGRAPTFLMLTGYEQVRSIVAEIAGDHDAASKVELVLPETGVCLGPGPSLAAARATEAGTWGGPAPAEAKGCCAADVGAKAQSKKGRGCGP